MSDALLRPSIATVETGKRPWPLSWQFYLAFLCGAGAVTLIALLNARRLGIRDRRAGAIAGLGIVAVGISVVLPVLVEGSTRYAARGVALAACLGMYLIQRRTDRAFHFGGAGRGGYAKDGLPFLGALGVAFLQYWATHDVDEYFG